MKNLSIFELQTEKHQFITPLLLVFLSGSPSLLRTKFTGCVKEVVVNGNTVDFAAAQPRPNVVFGCPVAAA